MEMKATQIEVNGSALTDVTAHALSRSSVRNRYDRTVGSRAGAAGVGLPEKDGSVRAGFACAVW